MAYILSVSVYENAEVIFTTAGFCYNKATIGDENK